jgi:hypothetical protein
LQAAINSQVLPLALCIHSGTTLKCSFTIVKEHVNLFVAKPAAEKYFRCFLMIQPGGLKKGM